MCVCVCVYCLYTLTGLVNFLSNVIYRCLSKNKKHLLSECCAILEPYSRVEDTEELNEKKDNVNHFANYATEEFQRGDMENLNKIIIINIQQKRLNNTLSAQSAERERWNAKF